MAEFLELRVRTGIRHFALTGAILGAMLQLGWTPREPYAHMVTIASAAANWAPLTPLFQRAESAIFAAMEETIPRRW